MKHQSNWTLQPENRKKGFRIHFIIFLFTAPTIWLIWYFTDTSYLWPVWPTGFWAIGVVFHYLGVYVFKKSIDY